MAITRREFLKKTFSFTTIALLSDLFFDFKNLTAEENKSIVNFSPDEDIMIPSTDTMCVNFCGIRVRRVNGVIRAIYGNPESPYNKGHLCPKGQAGIFHTYNPYRIKAPLKRTNPNKGLGEDPRWKEISWEEAFDEIVKKLKEIKDEDPRGLTFHISHGKYLIGDKFTKAFCKAFGTPNHVHRTTVCEAARHVADEITWGGHGPLPDLEYTKFFINMGANFTEAEQWARWLDRTSLERIVDGDMKMVVIEPRLSNTASKANEWIPIRPGKDALFLLAMAKELIKMNYIDVEFLKNYTDAVYLVGEDKKFYKDEKGNFYVYDVKNKKIVPYDESEEISLDAEVTIEGKKYKTAFRIFKEYVLSLKDKEVEEITGIPYSTIKRIAKEFGENANIGKTIEIDGEKLRYRPVCVYTFRGLVAKEYGTQNWRAGLIVNMLVGNFDAVGGLLLYKADPNYKGMKPSKCEYPPQRVDLQESVFYPFAGHNVAQQVAYTYSEPEKYGLPYKPKMAIFYATNRILSTSDIQKQIEGYKNVYSVNINVVLDETAEFADIVLPDKTYLESWHYSSTRWVPDAEHKAIRQPVVDVFNQPYDAFTILMEIAKRLSILDKFIDEINKEWKIEDKEKKFEKRVYDSKEAVQILWEAETGKPFDYAIQHGLYIKNRDVKKRYLSEAEKYNGKGKPKMHFYAEQLVYTKEKVFEIMEKNDNVKKIFMEWFEENDLNELRKILDIVYSPLPLKEHAFPTPHRKRDPKEYPFYLITYKRMYRTQTDFHALNPLLNEIANDSDTNYCLINTKTAGELGIGDGDKIIVESKIGKVEAIARLTEGIRPDTVAISYHYGRFSKSFPSYAKKGVLPNFILELHPDLLSGENSFNDTKVKIYKA
ncbi:MAG: molybdopterin-dependent oxidoreductase [candidate division WOR-3 bacterium]